jgi:hypothetical protein
MGIPARIVKNANGMTIGVATSQWGAVAVAQHLRGAVYIRDNQSGHCFLLDGTGQRSGDKSRRKTRQDQPKKDIGQERQRRHEARELERDSHSLSTLGGCAFFTPPRERKSSQVFRHWFQGRKGPS